MKLISYGRTDGTMSVGLLRDELEGRPYDLIRAIEMFNVAQDQPVPLLADMMDLLDLGLLDTNYISEVDDFVNECNLLDYLMELDYHVLSPVPRPRTIYALGRNYPAHAKESGADVPDEPIIFNKATTAVIGPEDNVVYKKWLTRVDPEVELAVVIGQCGCNIPEEEAHAYIAGFTIINDVTARDLQAKDLGNAHPWFRSKGIDTFCPMGPNLTLPDEIVHPVELDVEMRVNGELRQQDNTRNMTFKIPFLISWISRYHTLYPGDIISTGTPEGMKPVQVGDVMEASVEGIGVLRNTVVAEE